MGAAGSKKRHVGVLCGSGFLGLAGASPGLLAFAPRFGQRDAQHLGDVPLQILRQAARLVREERPCRDVAPGDRMVAPVAAEFALARAELLRGRIDHRR